MALVTKLAQTTFKLLRINILSQILIGRVGTTLYQYIESDELGNVPPYLAEQGVVLCPVQSPPPAGQHGQYWLQEGIVWLWIREYPVINNTVYFETNTLANTRVVRCLDEWGDNKIISPSDIGAVSPTQLTSTLDSTLATAKAYSDSILTSYLAKMADVVVTTDASGNWTYNYAAKGYTVPPVVTYGIEATGGHTINITSRTTTSVSGVVSKPKSAVIGVLPYEAAGAGIKVNLHIKPAT